MFEKGDIKIIVVGLIGLIMYWLFIPYIKPLDLEMERANMFGQDLVCKEK